MVGAKTCAPPKQTDILMPLLEDDSFLRTSGHASGVNRHKEEQMKRHI